MTDIVIGRQGLTLAEIITASVTRANRWHKGGIDDWSALEWAGAMCGEAGECANAAKKLRRLELSIPSVNRDEALAVRHYETTQQAKAAVGREVADTILYGLLVAARVDVNIEAVLIEVFNRKSEEYGFPERI